MLRAKDIRIFPITAVIIPMRELHRWSCWSSSEKKKPSWIEFTSAGLKIGRVNKGAAAVSWVGFDRYISTLSSGGYIIPLPSTPGPNSYRAIIVTNLCLNMRIY